MKAVVFTDYVTCSYCKKAKAALASGDGIGTVNRKGDMK